MLVRWLIDPMLSSKKVRQSLRDQAYKERKWIKLVVRRLIDPTIFPPPSYTRKRADAVYGDAFRRAVEFVARSGIPGDVLEFGTCMGYTARWLAGLIVEYDLNAHLWLYDSFEGLPELVSDVDRQSYEATGKAWFKGAMKVDSEVHERIRRSLSRIVPANRLHVVKGYYEDVLSGNLPEERIALVHLDCDLYASAKYVLDTLLQRGLLQDGTVLLLDDYNCSRANPHRGERRALVEAFGAQDRYSYTPWFSYGWHGQVCFIHDSKVG
jgi:predicted O-methyltransferase YrrM